MELVFVGMGAIGMPMAQRLMSAGHAVTGVEASPDRRAALAAAGITSLHTSIAEASGTTIVMVATPDQLDAVVTAAIARGVEGETWVIMSTVGPESAARAARELTAHGASCLDAPVTGGVSGAEQGTLRIFVSGDEAVAAAMLPVLSAMGTPFVVGDRVGIGQSFKVVNQHLCSVHLVACAEALELAAAMGLDSDRVLALLGAGAASSWMLGDRGPRMVHPDGRVTSTIDIFVKDSGLVADAAHDAGFSAPLLDAARERFLLAAAAGRGREDDSTVNLTYRT